MVKGRGHPAAVAALNSMAELHKWELRRDESGAAYLRALREGNAHVEGTDADAVAAQQALLGVGVGKASFGLRGSAAGAAGVALVTGAKGRAAAAAAHHEANKTLLPPPPPPPVCPMCPLRRECSHAPL